MPTPAPRAAPPAPAPARATKTPPPPLDFPKRTVKVRSCSAVANPAPFVACRFVGPPVACCPLPVARCLLPSKKKMRIEPNFPPWRYRKRGFKVKTKPIKPNPDPTDTPEMRPPDQIEPNPAAPTPRPIPQRAFAGPSGRSRMPPLP